jgi:hypothetical protein
MTEYFGICNGECFFILCLHFLFQSLINARLFLQDNVMTICIVMCVICILALGTIVSLSPLDDVNYRGWSSKRFSSDSPYTSPCYLGWALASVFALVLTGVLPAVSWFATYRFSLSSAVCMAIFIGK